MNVTPPAEFRKWFILGLVVQLVAAWFSLGYHHPDEHFQVLEFCNYRLGLSPACDLPWEYASLCRSSLQPSLAYVLALALKVVGMYNPFTIAFLLRLIMALLTWLVTSRMVRLLLPEMATHRGRQALVWCSFFLWFVPYIGVRFSAENISGLLFFLAFTFLYPGQAPVAKRAPRLLLAGLLIGIAFFTRIQIGFAIIALGSWLLWYGKWPLRHWLILCAGGIVAIALSVCLDRWFYGQWAFTPWNYFNANILQHKAANFGTDPLWYYFTKFLDIGVPPISVALLPLFFIGLRHKPVHVLSWIAVVFIAGHSLIGHKEVRFLFPISIAFIFLACSGFDWLVQQRPDRKLYRWAIPLFAALNSIMLVIKICTPAHEAMNYYRAIYNYAGKHQTILATSGNTVYNLVGVCVNFYQPKGLEEQTITTAVDLEKTLKNANGKTVIYLSRQVSGDTILCNFRAERIYCLLPDWLTYLNPTDWQSRSYFWSIYRVYPE